MVEGVLHNSCGQVYTAAGGSHDVIGHYDFFLMPGGPGLEAVNTAAPRPSSRKGWPPKPAVRRVSGCGGIIWISLAHATRG